MLLAVVIQGACGNPFTPTLRVAYPSGIETWRSIDTPWTDTTTQRTVLVWKVVSLFPKGNSTGHNDFNEQFPRIVLLSLARCVVDLIHFENRNTFNEILFTRSCAAPPLLSSLLFDGRFLFCGLTPFPIPRCAPLAVPAASQREVVAYS